MDTFITICLLFWQFAGCLLVGGLGACLTRGISNRLALALGVVLMIFTLIYLIEAAPLTYVPETAALWLAGFGGGMAFRVMLDTQKAVGSK